jgi:hypothetical protein
MSDEPIASGGAVDSGASAIPSTAPQAPTPNDAPLSIRDAMAELSASRQAEAASEPKPRDESGRFVSQKQDLPDGADAGSEANASPGEETDGNADPDGENLPSIEPPRSWTKEQKDEFSGLPRHVQEIVAQREQEREATLRRSQNEAAEQRKALEAKHAEAEQTRKDHEEKLFEYERRLNYETMKEFDDIRNWDDVRNLARTDPIRYGEWQAAQSQLQDIKAQADQARQRRQSEEQSTFQKFASEQDQIASDRIPDLKNPEKSKAAQELALNWLRKSGFSDEDLAGSWNGQKPLYLRDAKLQEMAFKAAKWDAAQEAAKVAKAKEVPTVQRAGVPASKAERVHADQKALLAQLDKTGSREDAFKALMAGRRVSR